jgi:hypothetical protein
VSGTADRIERAFAATPPRRGIWAIVIGSEATMEPGTVASLRRSGVHVHEDVIDMASLMWRAYLAMTGADQRSSNFF